MTLINSTAHLWTPTFKNVSAAPGMGTLGLIDAADEGLATILRAPRTGSIAKVLWATRQVTTGATISVRLETVDESANPARPSGTLFASGASGVSAIADTDDNVAVVTTLTTPCSVTLGDKLAVIVKQPTSAPGVMQVAVFSDDVSEFPYLLLNTGVSPATSWSAINSAAPMIGLEYSDGAYSWIPGCWPFYAVNSNVYNGGSTPDRIGLRFKFPFPVRVGGWWAWADLDGDFQATLYDSDGVTPLASTPFSVDKDTRLDTGAGVVIYPFASTADLARDTFYRLVLTPTTTTSLTLYDFQTQSTAALDAFPGGQNLHYTSAKNPATESDWTNVTTRRPFLGPLVCGFDDGLSPTFPRVHPGMGGGMRG